MSASGWADSEAGSASTSEGILGNTGSQVVLTLRDRTTIYGEIVRALHLADGAVVVSLRPWGCHAIERIPRENIRRAAVASMKWEAMHEIACRQSKARARS